VLHLQNDPSTQIIYESVVYDTNNAYNSNTGIYTVPISGTYLVDACLSVASGNNAPGLNGNLYIAINGPCSNGGSGQAINELLFYAQSNVGVDVPFSGIFSYATGDQLIVCFNLVSSANFEQYPATSLNRFHIVRIGN